MEPLIVVGAIGLLVAAVFIVRYTLASTRKTGSSDDTLETTGRGTDVEYFSNGPLGPRIKAECSDNACPCSPSVQFAPGEGYLYVSPEVVEFRRDARSIEEAQAKVQRVADSLDANVLADPALYSGLMICGQAAGARNLDLKVAVADAQRWWRTGEMPLRPTPTASKPKQESFDPFNLDSFSTAQARSFSHLLFIAPEGTVVEEWSITMLLFLEDAYPDFAVRVGFGTEDEPVIGHFFVPKKLLATRFPSDEISNLGHHLVREGGLPAKTSIIFVQQRVQIDKAEELGIELDFPALLALCFPDPSGPNFYWPEETAP